MKLDIIADILVHIFRTLTCVICPATPCKKNTVQVVGRSVAEYEVRVPCYTRAVYQTPDTYD